jgi:G3E family GTPase
MQQQLTIPVYILSGFLGSGKTTLLNRILDHAKSTARRGAVLLNEVGDVNVEGQLIGPDVPMAEMLGGCICCTIRADVGMELMQLARQHNPDVIWIESTGIAQPLEIMDAVTEASLYAKLELKGVVTVVDARQLLDKLRVGGGRTFKLMKEQIRAASLLVLNKIDLVPGDELAELEAALADWNPNARILRTTRSELDCDLLYDETRRFGAPSDRHAHSESCNDEHCDHSDHSHDHNHEHNHSSMHDYVNVVTYYFKRSLSSLAFERFLKQLPDEIYRAKGIVTFEDTASRFLFQYAFRESDFMRITPQGTVNDVAVFIGEGFSQSWLLAELERLDAAQ